MTSIARRAVEALRDRRLAAAAARDQLAPPPSAFASFGAGSWIVPPARVWGAEWISVGDDVVILEHAQLSVVRRDGDPEPRLVFGDGCRIGSMCHVACAGEVVFGARVLTAGRVYVGDTSHGYDDPSLAVLDQPMAAPRPVRIGSGSFLGIGAVVTAGVTLGEHAYVAAGAVVTTDVASRTVVAGNPAVPVRRWDEVARAWVRC